MKMKITPTLLSIPPYLSTAWEHIAALRVEPGTETLIVTLMTGTQIEVPQLAPEELEAVFQAHSLYAEKKTGAIMPFSLSLPIDPEGGISSLGQSMQHNPEQANLPDMPPQVLEKIGAVAKAFGLEDSSLLSPPVEGCNCTYCQIVRSFAGQPVNEEAAEEITEADLSFKDWEIEQKADKLFQVTNPLDTNEHYNVFLGTPVGCTCGEKNCEHIKAVLHS